MTLLEQLNRLSELDSRWEFYEGRAGYPPCCIIYLPMSEPALRISADGQLQGWEALGFMFSSMQGRYQNAPADIDDGEVAVLAGLMKVRSKDLTPELILSTFIAWREVIQK